MGILFVGSGHGPKSSCQISACYKFFPGKSYFYRTIFLNADAILNKISVAVGNWNSAERTVFFLEI